MRLLLCTILLLLSGLGLNAQNAIKKTADKKGIASFYHDKFEGRKTATGEVFVNNKYTAASNKLKLGTFVKVTNLSNGNIVYVRVNDRMARHNPRLIDLASVAAEELGFKDDGTTKVKVEVVPVEEGRMGIYAQKEIAKYNDKYSNKL